MARIISRSGRTAAIVEADRLAGLTASPFRGLLLGLALSASVIGASLPAPIHRSLAPFILAAALAGFAWTVSAPTGIARLLSQQPRTLHTVSAAMDITVCAVLGLLAGWFCREALSPRTLALFGAEPDLIAKITGLTTLPPWIALLPAAAVAAFAALAALRASGARSLLARLQSGLQGELDTERALTALPDTYAVASNVLLRSPTGGTIEADYVVLGPTGIAVLECKRWAGTITPGPQTWTTVHKNRTAERPNPLPKLLDTCRAVETALGAPSGSAAPLLVLLAGTLTAPPQDGQVRILTRTADIVPTLQGLPSSWPLSITPEEAAHSLTAAA